MSGFEIVSAYQPQGDQPKAIDALVENYRQGEKYQTLMGVTGSGKTFTMAHTIARYNKPALVLSHNKTLAAQLFEEFRELMPNNAVEYFVSYYDYYQPEAYIPQRDIYIERTRRVTTIWIDCAWPQRVRSFHAATWSWSRACRASLALARRMFTKPA